MPNMLACHFFIIMFKVIQICIILTHVYCEYNLWSSLRGSHFPLLFVDASLMIEYGKLVDVLECVKTLRWSCDYEYKVANVG